ncbi:MAG: hypothetical protein CMO55_10975 [Verrucomicrobiales bacterium]|nr:hypothetical protein [Verrucomicrobiales bacterium]
MESKFFDWNLQFEDDEQSVLIEPDEETNFFELYLRGADVDEEFFSGFKFGWNQKGVRSHTLANNFGWRIVSTELRSAIEESTTDLTFWEIPGFDGFSVVVPLVNVSGCVNTDESVGRLRRLGDNRVEIDSIERLVVDSNFVPDCEAFTITEDPVTIFVSTKLKDVIANFVPGRYNSVDLH